MECQIRHTTIIIKVSQNVQIEFDTILHKMRRQISSNSTNHFPVEPKPPASLSVSVRESTTS